jgi:hypothetical protein
MGKLLLSSSLGSGNLFALISASEQFPPTTPRVDAYDANHPVAVLAPDETSNGDNQLTVAPDEMSQSASSNGKHPREQRSDQKSGNLVETSQSGDGDGDGDGSGSFNPETSLSLLLDSSHVEILRLRILQETHRLRQKIQKLQNKAAAEVDAPQITFSWHANQPGWKPQPPSSLWMGTKDAKAFPKTWNHHHIIPSPTNPPNPHSPPLSNIPPPQPWMHDGHPTITTVTTVSTKSESEWGEEKEEEVPWRREPWNITNRILI